MRGYLRASRFARRTTEKRETARSLSTVASNFINHMPLSCLSFDASSAQTVTPHAQPKHTSVQVSKIHCF